MERKIYTTLNHRKMNKTSLASLVNRIKTNVDGLDSKEWMKDDQFMIFWNALLESLSEFQVPIGKVRKNALTPTLERTQMVRYRAYQALKRANNVFAVSENVEEKAAFKLLDDQFKALKIKIQNNKENRTTNYNLLVSKLNSSEFLPSVGLLKLNDFVLRLETANNKFNTTEQSSSMQKVRGKESFNSNSQQQLYDSYLLVGNYVQAMNAINKVPFDQLFGAINEAREYFARDMSYRDTLKKNRKADAANATKTNANVA